VKLGQLTLWKQRQELLPSAERKARCNLCLYTALHLRFGKLHDPDSSLFTCRWLSLSCSWGLPAPGTHTQNPGGISARRDLSTPTEITWFPPALPQTKKERPNIALQY